jgi:hypothetical protein
MATAVVHETAVGTTVRPSIGLMYGALCLVIVLQHIYLFTFNWYPDLRLPLSASLAACHLVLAAVTILLRPAAWNMLLLAAAAVLLITIIPPHFLGLGEVTGFDATLTIRKLILPLLMIWLLAYPLALPRNLLWLLAIGGTLLGATIAFTGPPTYAGNPTGVYTAEFQRLASITGDLEQMHPSARYIVLQTILIDLLRRGGFMSRYLAWPLIGLCLVVLVGYGARNSMMMLAAYYLTFVYFRFYRITIVRWSPPILLVLAILGATVMLQIASGTSDWGSGRIGVWSYRLQLIANRDLVTLLFGGGIGADVIWTPQWWFFTEGSTAHNDYLHIMMEHGLVGLAFMALFVLGIWRRVFLEGKAIIVGVLVNSFFANGFFQSPLLATSLAMVLSLSILVSLVRVEPVRTPDADAEASGLDAAPGETAAVRP